MSSSVWWIQGEICYPVHVKTAVLVWAKHSRKNWDFCIEMQTFLFREFVWISNDDKTFWTKIIFKWTWENIQL